MIIREISEKIRRDYNKGKIIVVLGPRQVGKTTLFNQLIEKEKNVLKLNCDDYDDKIKLENKNSTQLRELIGSYNIVLIDEAQRVKNIGLTLKIIADLKLSSQILVTGSSSLDIANEINEPVTGRMFEYKLLPFSLKELENNSSKKEQERLLYDRLIFGLYPEVVTKPEDRKRLLTTLANNYLYKDLLEYKGIRKPELLQKLVRALALQVGSEVSYNELANLIGVNKETIENYIDLLEKCFVVFRLNSFSGNIRSEIKKGKKIYFYDNGIRNAVISNFSPIELRTDVGALWENFLISQRVKKNLYNQSYCQMYFWRTQQQQEIDLIEEEDGMLKAFEFKWNERKNATIPKAFADNYNNYSFSLINQNNYLDFLE
jgi:predicted AAA+ superfamily ATPase